MARPAATVELSVTLIPETVTSGHPAINEILQVALALVSYAEALQLGHTQRGLYQTVSGGEFVCSEGGDRISISRVTASNPNQP